jgi:hypothetical protein
MRRFGIWAVLFVLALAIAPVAEGTTPAAAVLRSGLPNHILTPGAFNPAVTQATIQSTICVVGWTSRIRPPTSYTTPLKRAQIATYGYRDRNMSDYEEDHLISLELGGSPRSTKNLWPEPHSIIAGGIQVGSYAKDGMENYLRRAVCAGRMRLATAQGEIAKNWVYYWKRAGRPRG